VRRMIAESTEFADRVGWFTALVSKESHLPALRRAAFKAGVTEVKVVEMSQGQKRSRFIGWKFGVTSVGGSSSQ